MGGEIPPHFAGEFWTGLLLLKSATFQQLQGSWETTPALGKQSGVPQPPRDPDGSRPVPLSLPPQIFWVGPLTGAVLASLIYNFILFPDTKTLAQRLAILTGTSEMEEVDGVEPQEDEPPSSPGDTKMENMCQIA